MLVGVVFFVQSFAIFIILNTNPHLSELDKSVHQLDARLKAERDKQFKIIASASQARLRCLPGIAPHLLAPPSLRAMPAFSSAHIS